MKRFAAIVRIGDYERHRTEDQALSNLRLHVEVGCWSSPPDREIPAGMPVIASHVGPGLGWFLLGVFTGEPIPIPWPRAPETADHIGHAVNFVDAAFRADPERIRGAKGRHLRWLTTDEFDDALAELRVDSRHSPLVRGR